MSFELGMEKNIFFVLGIKHITDEREKTFLCFVIVLNQTLKSAGFQEKSDEIIISECEFF